MKSRVSNVLSELVEIKKLLDCYKEISFIEYTTLAELDKNDFHSTESFKANISQQIILAMLNGYAEGRYHAGNSNYIEDKESDKIIGISYNARGFKDPEKDFAGFAEYIKKNIRLIPSDLRDHFTIHIGHNFGDACGILIKGDEIKIIDQDVINDQGMTIGNKGITYYDYNNEQLKKIYKKVTEELSK